MRVCKLQSPTVVLPLMPLAFEICLCVESWCVCESQGVQGAIRRGRCPRAAKLGGLRARAALGDTLCVRVESGESRRREERVRTSFYSRYHTHAMRNPAQPQRPAAARSLPAARLQPDPAGHAPHNTDFDHDPVRRARQ